MPFEVSNYPWSSAGLVDLTSTRDSMGPLSSRRRRGIRVPYCGILLGFELILVVLSSLSYCQSLLYSVEIVKIEMRLSLSFIRYFAYLSESKSLGLHSLGSILQVTLFYYSEDTVFKLL